jgi:hypothetical protein
MFFLQKYWPFSEPSAVISIKIDTTRIADRVDPQYFCRNVGEKIAFVTAIPLGRHRLV